MHRYDYHLCVYLQDTEEIAERHLRVPSTTTLRSLHQILQIAYNWQDKHMHMFELDGVRYSDDPEFADQPEHATLHQLLSPNDKLTYHYDFGDDWRVEIEVLRTYKFSCHYPIVLAADGAPPPEDCGGIPGYEELLQVFRDPSHPDPSGRRAWAGDFDPEDNLLEQIEASLKKAFGPHPPAAKTKGPARLLVKRYPRYSTTVLDGDVDLVLVKEESSDKMLAAKVGLRDADHSLVLEVLEEAESLQRQLVVEDPHLADYLKQHGKLAVTTDALPELDLAYFQLEHASAAMNLSFGHLSEELLREFLNLAFVFSLTAPWQKIADYEMLRVEGMARKPLFISVLGGAGESYGLAVFDDAAQAASVLKGGRGQPLAILSFLEGNESFALTKELLARGIGLHNYDVVPAVLTLQPETPSSTYNLMVDAMLAVMAQLAHVDLPGSRVFDLSGGRAFDVTWPVDPADFIQSGPVRVAPKPGRNDPCWCGSGKKYKKCHLGKD